MSDIRLIETLPDDIQTPAANRVAIFVDATTGLPSYKNDAGESAPIGDAGSFPGGTLSVALNEATPETLASASTLNIGAAAANTVTVTGTTPITAFDTVAAGAIRRVIFGGVLTLEHDPTALILPTGGDITTAVGDAAEFLSLGSGHWRCLWYSTASGEALAGGGGGGGGVTGFTTSLETAFPNNTTNVSAIAASGGSTDQSIAIVVKGTGALMLSIPDQSTAANGNLRGARAVDLQTNRSDPAMVASGSNSFIAGGRDNRSSGSESSTFGYNNIASASRSHAWGRDCVADALDSRATGYAGKARGMAYSQVHGFSTGGQHSECGAREVTVNASSIDLGSSEGAWLKVPSDTGITFTGKVMARYISGANAGSVMGWTFEGVIKNIGGTTSLEGTPTVNAIGAALGATLVISADNTNDVLALTATGDVGAIVWTFLVDSCEG